MLSASFISDPDRLARFEREARTLASLNHPGIGAIYGLEHASIAAGEAAVPALVLELIEGDTLTDRIRRGPIPLAAALSIARQIADALDVAHERGIVHRDLKPANIKITTDDVVKVLDFGLAKTLVSGWDGAPHATVTVSGTVEGIVLGTPAYMSPEQAQGNAVDKRADVWAFGCVLYEMLTGAAPFTGESVSDTIAAILEREPNLSPPPAFDRMTRIVSTAAPEFGPVISPDGKWVAYLSNARGPTDVWVRFIAGGDPVNLTASADNTSITAFRIPTASRPRFSAQPPRGARPNVWSRRRAAPRFRFQVPMAGACCMRPILTASI